MRKAFAETRPACTSLSVSVKGRNRNSRVGLTCFADLCTRPEDFGLAKIDPRQEHEQRSQGWQLAGIVQSQVILGISDFFAFVSLLKQVVPSSILLLLVAEPSWCKCSCWSPALICVIDGGRRKDHAALYLSKLTTGESCKADVNCGACRSSIHRLRLSRSRPCLILSDVSGPSPFLASSSLLSPYMCDKYLHLN